MIVNSVEDMKVCVTENTKRYMDSKQREVALVFALHGDLGSGKTTFAQSFGKSLGVTEHMHSPTFLIMKRYDIHHSFFKKLIHIDAYRLSTAQEIERLGWNDIVNDPHNIICVEWPEHIENVIPKKSVHIDFKFVDDTTREVKVR